MNTEFLLTTYAGPYKYGKAVITVEKRRGIPCHQRGEFRAVLITSFFAA
jgi:hypothetical protein